jgi:signal transduction histidine kinase
MSTSPWLRQVRRGFDSLGRAAPGAPVVPSAMRLQLMPAPLAGILIAGVGALITWAAIQSRLAIHVPGARGIAIGLTELMILIVAVRALPGPALRRPGVDLALLLLLAGTSAVLGFFQPDGGFLLGLVITAVNAPGRGTPGAVLTGVMVVVGAGVTYWAGNTVVGASGDALGIVAAYGFSSANRRFRVEQLGRAATMERERLAREIHDILAHTLSALAVQLEAARVLADQRPGDPGIAGAIDRAHDLARSGLEETRRAVGALRGEGAPGPDRLRQLVDEFEHDSRVPCRLEIGELPPLPPDLWVAIYRTAQEALTNVRKHAEADEVGVTLRHGGVVELTVEDRGRIKASMASGGYGLTGLRERAALLGGGLEAGPTGDGFRVRLWLPG